MSLKAVLFDLDDTLYDHQYSSRSALAALYEQNPVFRQISLDELERQHSELLEAYHLRMLRGEMTLDEARATRFRDLLARHGGRTEPSDILATVTLYRETYLRSERLVPGALALLIHLRAEGLKIGLVTNNTVVEQTGKLSRLGLTPLIDVLVISEAEGIAKPDARMFSRALERLGCTADETIMVGDSWSADVAGANAAGIRAVWLNRYGRTCPDRTLASEVATLEAALEWLI
ncbi:MAG: HAD family hydrolase [Chloroflexota bacterium]